jgi:hypothetical protein
MKNPQMNYKLFSIGVDKTPTRKSQAAVFESSEPKLNIFWSTQDIFDRLSQCQCGLPCTLNGWFGRTSSVLISLHITQPNGKPSLLDERFMTTAHLKVSLAWKS